MTKNFNKLLENFFRDKKVSIANKKKTLRSLSWTTFAHAREGVFRRKNKSRNAFAVLKKKQFNCNNFCLSLSLSLVYVKQGVFK